MRVLFVTIAYPKKGNRNLYSDLAEEIVKQGNEITVISTESDVLENELLIDKDTGVEQLKVHVRNQFGVNLIKKGFINMSIPFLLKKAINSYLSDRNYDIVLYSTPPVTIAPTIQFLKNKFDAKTYLMLKDIFPQNAADLKVFSEKSFMFKYFKRKEEELYNLSDKIGCMSPANLEFVEKEYPNKYSKKLELFPNTIKIRTYDDELDKSKIRENFNLPKDKIIFILGGNLGKPQAINFLLEAIDFCKDITEVYFVIVGKGSEAEKVRNYAVKSNNLTYINYLESDKYSLLMKSSDIGLITLNHNFTIPNIPSRLLSYMHDEIPIFAVTDKSTDLNSIIVDQAKCGWWCESKNKEVFREKICKIISEKNMYKEYGENGRYFLEENYNVTDSVSKIIKLKEAEKDV